MWEKYGEVKINYCCLRWNQVNDYNESRKQNHCYTYMHNKLLLKCIKKINQSRKRKHKLNSAHLSSLLVHSFRSTFFESNQNRFEFIDFETDTSSFCEIRCNELYFFSKPFSNAIINRVDCESCTSRIFQEKITVWNYNCKKHFTSEIDASCILVLSNVIAIIINQTINFHFNTQ